MRRAWVEIQMENTEPFAGRVALHAEGVGRNNFARHKHAKASRVALHAEGVGRNIETLSFVIPDRVALHAEGVGRNSKRTRR